MTTFTSKNGLPCNKVHLVMDDNDHSTWLYTGCGLVRLDKAELEAWKTDLTRAVHPTLFDNSDGVSIRSSVEGGYGPRITLSPDGRLWFLPGNGVVSVIDPLHPATNQLPPPVHVEEVTADDKTVWQDLAAGSAANRRLPALTHRLEIRYTALSFVAPEKIRFKYKLEGYDRDWQDGRNSRRAVYTSLPPRKYRFRVIACNNSGVWNQTGDRLEFSIAPAYYQTSWFYASCVVAFLGMLWGMYRLRLYQIRREFNAQLDGRVEERMRVARELHDTLLQSFQASLILMQAARNIFERLPEKAVQSLDKAITTAAGAVAEGRTAIQDLRVHPAGGADLAQLLTAAGQELAHSEEAPGNPPVVRRDGGRRAAGSGSRCSRTRSTGSPGNCCGTRSATPRPAGSRWRSATRAASSACTSATTEKGSTPKSSRPAGVPDTGGCRGCGNGRIDSAANWSSGAKRGPAPKRC